MLRVLSVASSLCVGGDERRLLTLAQHINRSFFEHLIVCIQNETSISEEPFGTFRDQFMETESKIIDLEVDVESLRALRTRPVEFFKEGTRSLLQCVDKIRRIVRDYKIDVIDAHVGLGNRLGTIGGLLTGRPALVTVYDPTEYRRGSLAFAGYQAMFCCAAGVITDDETVWRKIKQWTILQPKRTFIIPSRIPAPEPASSYRSILEQYHLRVDVLTRVVGVVANLVHFKGHSLFVEAAGLVARSHPECMFLIAGFPRCEASYVDSLWRRAAELGIAHRLQIISHPGAIGDIWQLIDIYVNPSMRDSVALSIIEAMSLGKPAVVADVGGSSSLITHEQTGLLVRAGDVDGLAAGILRLLEDPRLARSLGDAAFARYVSSYGCPQMMVREMEDAFVEVATHSSEKNEKLRVSQSFLSNGVRGRD